MSRVLVTGGAGYVGSHVVRALLDAGRDVVVIDDLSKGHRAAVGQAELIVADIADQTTLDRVLGDGTVGAVIHMVASCEVGASMVDPSSYYAQNVVRGIGLLDAIVRHGVERCVFSSTAAVYGDPVQIPIVEDHILRPTNPYGETKLTFERALDWYDRAYGVDHVALRYFNAAGAHPDGSIGEDHEPESHLIPCLLRAVGEQDRAARIFGTDYPTRDGTCVRDYVHVCDLAEAHVLALGALERGGLVDRAFNLGHGEGHSVREVISAVGRVTGRQPRTIESDRRPGDPATLIASAERARRQLLWSPELSGIDSIVGSAWNWISRNPRGFGDRG